MKVVSATTGTRDGHLRRPAALQTFLKRRRWPLAIATGEQVHRDRVAIVSRLKRAAETPGTDGLLTSTPGQPLGIFTADCLPIFLSDETKGVVGCLHAGWRGVRGEILLKAVRLMRRTWKSRPKDIAYWLGPCIQRCCFAVQWDVARHFPASRKRWGDRWTVDMPAEIRRQARRLNLREARRRTNEACTMHDQRYFSFRRNGTMDRQISIIFSK